LLDVSKGYNTGQIREQTHWHTQSLDCARSGAQL